MRRILKKKPICNNMEIREECTVRLKGQLRNYFNNWV